MRLRNLLLAQPFWLVYEGEGGEGGAGGGAGGGEGGAGGGAGGGEGGAGGGNPPPKTFTQDQVNGLLAEEKRKHQTTIAKQVADLEALRKAKGLTEKEREALAGRIEELNNSMLTKEQLAAKDRDKITKEYKEQLDGVTKERDTWATRYQDSTIQRAIVDASVMAEAFAPSQIVALLRPLTRLTEVVDGEGNPVPGEFIPKVKLSDLDKDGKPVTLDLTVAEALKRMKDRPSDFGNLFKSGVAGGIGGTSGSGIGGAGGAGGGAGQAPKDPEAYRKWREANRPKRHGTRK